MGLRRSVGDCDAFRKSLHQAVDGRLDHVQHGDEILVGPVIRIGHIESGVRLTDACEGGVEGAEHAQIDVVSGARDERLEVCVVGAVHGDDEVDVGEPTLVNLSGGVVMPVPMIVEDLNTSGVGSLPDVPVSGASGIDLDDAGQTAARQALTQDGFANWGSADVPEADDGHPIDAGRW